ncbi:hypothetical protein PHAVU_008G094200 [Phaseolus vulgaris]|uniref:Gamma-interferon-inducible lysosomal thiol reductase n=1 Tax=Phaseolus vulgaris TaxID=3885 RepID=V7B323_PHAVU|nr:hypothetical protein PHAVU_008G094200g [Phaseolus vulgaris]ESW12214.1 hypothetical protein PHAVU_008G094200g [Phaseolus vulgaris]
MVSPKLAIVSALTLLSFIFINKSDAASYYPSGLHAASAEVTPFASQKVNLSVYYASLSQPSATFIVKNLEEIFHTDLINIINLQLVPWANAYVNKTNQSIICQNGPDECELNSLETCALNVWNDVSKHYALIYCFEFLAIEGRHKNWQDCFSQLDLPEEPVLNCYIGGNATEIGQKYINETAPLEFLPLVIVNNQSVGKEYENFTRYVCEAYRGTPVPAVCNATFIRNGWSTNKL